jgi:hypothetical protein
MAYSMRILVAGLGACKGALFAAGTAAIGSKNFTYRIKEVKTISRGCKNASRNDQKDN